MKILAVECSAPSVSSAVIEEGQILASSFIHVKMTHSQTLLPMIDSMLSSAGIGFDEIDGFAISAGPGSFTGVRIGIAAVKGLAAPKNLPCAPVSTLLAVAENFTDRDCIVCAVMDARCHQVYNALFRIKDGKITRLCEDRALMCEELAAELKRKRTALPILVAGDGTDVFMPFATEIKNVRKSGQMLRFQTASGVGLAAECTFLSGNTVSPDRLLPVYLRLPQAERELKQKKESLK